MNKFAINLTLVFYIAGLISSNNAFAEVAMVVTESAVGSSGNIAVIDAENGAGPWGNEKGFGCGNDIVTASFESVAYPIVFKVVPYAQCKNEVMNGDVVGCFGMATGDVYVDATTKFGKIPLYYNSSVILMKGSGGKSEKNLARIPKNSKIGIVIGYEYATEIMNLAKRGVHFETSNSERTLIKKLLSGRLDYAIVQVDALKTAKLIASQAKVNWSEMSIAFLGPKQGTYLGFSNTNTQATEAMAKFNEGMLRIEKSGKLKEIMKSCKKYLD